MKEPLLLTHPALVAEWHPTMNGELAPDKLVAGSTAKVWWRCSKGPDHEWQATVAKRTQMKNPTGCPFCRSLQVSVTNSLASLFPATAAEWHPTRNGGLSPDKIVAGSMKHVWWRCPKGLDHEWQASVVNRTKKDSPRGCPFCAGKKLSVTNSLASLLPDVASQWHPTKNGSLTPEQVLAGSNQHFWWKCPNGPDHEWRAQLASRANAGHGCPYCAGQQVSVTNSLASLFPEAALQWHPTKNGTLTPDIVVAGSTKNIWWKCPNGPDHEWQATPDRRTGQGSGCPCCRGLQVSVTNSLASLFPEVALEWHPTKNGDVTPEKVVAGSNKKFWWKCTKREGHEWQAAACSRTVKENPSGCPYCSNHEVSETNSLAACYPGIAAEWHPIKNKNLAPDRTVAGSNRQVWWKCSNGPDHEWQTTVSSRTASGSGCPFCAGQKVSVTNSLATRFPEVAKQWHPKKNGDLTPDKVVAGTGQIVWWRCPEGPDHEWQATVSNRTTLGQGCPCCGGRQPSVTNSLASLFPEIAAEWHATKNGDLVPDQVAAGTHQKVWWKCPKSPDHEWETVVVNRTRGSGCPFCTGNQVSVTNSLASLFPKVAAEWHATRNGLLTPDQVTARSHLAAWWQCSKSPDHVWQTSVASRTSKNASGCHACNKGWTLEAIRGFVSSLNEHLQSFSPAELYLLFQQTGLLQMQGKGKAFVKALVTGRFPKEEIDKFVNGEASLVDEFVGDPSQTLEALESRDKKLGTEETLLDRADELIDDGAEEDDQKLPVVETKDVLGSLGLHVVTSADEEAVEFLLESAVAKIWKHAYGDEEAAVAQAVAFSGDGYAERVRTRFWNEYREAKDLPVPGGYAFTVEGKPQAPNLMQRHFAVRVREKNRVGNWSGTGAGKTLAAVLATRVVGSKLTVVCCPNSVVEGWLDAIKDIFPDSIVATKTFDPDWAAVRQAVGAGFSLRRERTPEGCGTRPDDRYLVLNYEAFQQAESAERVRALVERELIDFIIVDEIHYAKQRAVENISQRRQLVTALTTLAAERNPDLHVLGMSATPVINNLQEGKSMVELVSGLAHDEIDTGPTVPNCMKLHQRLVTLGIRWMPDYKKMLGYECKEERIAVDCAEFLDEIRGLGRNSTPLKLEQILTRARLPVIREHVKPKTLIYTYYIEGIDRLLRDALLEDGWKIGFYTGDDKSGKDAFIEGDLDVLIATAAIGTGVDRLQHVCNRLIINVLPWTRAEYDQLLGRIYRQGQVSKEEVTVIIPLTYALVNGQRWSWCESKLQRLAFKKSIADAAVDGVVPEGHLRSAAQAYQDVMAWLERLDAGEVETITRARMSVPLPDTDPADVKRRRRRYGDFSAMNRKWNQSESQRTHERLNDNPEEWAQYHTLYRETRREWAAVPYEEMIRWCQKRSGYVIGDFGCGEAKLAEVVSDRHTVHSFDHVAINDNVVACDIAHVPLDDETLDLAIFSLSLMGANFTDYLREAYRTLKLDGDLHIIEATSRFTDRDGFVAGLKGLGFAVVGVEDLWKFTHIRALKTERPLLADVDIRF